MKELSPSYPIAFMSRVYGVSPSGYHAWDGRAPSKRTREEARLEAEIRAAHQRNRETYGPERLQHDLRERHPRKGALDQAHPSQAGAQMPAEEQVQGHDRSNQNLPVAENLLEQNFTATAPNQVWTSDLTYIPKDEGWLYLAGHKDLFTGDLVGYAMSERMTRNLVSQSLSRAVTEKHLLPGLIHHSDRGERDPTNFGQGWRQPSCSIRRRMATGSKSFSYFMAISWRIFVSYLDLDQTDSERSVRQGGGQTRPMHRGQNYHIVNRDMRRTMAS